MTSLDKSTETRTEAPEEYFESRATDVEVETEVLSSDEPEPWDPEKIRIHTKHYSLRQLVDMIADGDVDLAPDFQRHYVWKRQQRWSLIESLLLGIPLPSFYFNENTSGLLQVVGAGVSDEDGRTKRNADARRDRTRCHRGVERVFWWHVKVQPNVDRIHFLYEAGSDDHGQGKIVVGLFKDHCMLLD